MNDDPSDLVRQAILESDDFVEAVFQGARRSRSSPWRKVVIRPVQLKDGRFLQFAYFDDQQDRRYNTPTEEAAARLDELLGLPFNSYRIRTDGETLRIQFSKKGRPIIHRQRHQAGSIPLDLAHDRQKPYLLPDGRPVPFLQAIGVMTATGRVRADQQRKFRQINEFLRQIENTVEVESLDRPLQVVDLGCGNAALTFAAYHYFNDLKGIPTRLVGVDRKAQLLEKHRRVAASLGWEHMTFEAAEIGAYHPDGSPDLTLALHACDTATDDALAQGIRWGSRFIFAAPCCHHHLQAQLERRPSPSPFEPIMRQNIFKERLGDILTDTFRALILRMSGYRTDLVEFVAAEHTPKNLLIRAAQNRADNVRQAAAEYRALRDYWNVRPYLEELLASELEPLLSLAQSTPS